MPGWFSTTTVPFELTATAEDFAEVHPVGQLQRVGDRLELQDRRLCCCRQRDAAARGASSRPRQTAMASK